MNCEGLQREFWGGVEMDEREGGRKVRVVSFLTTIHLVTILLPQIQPV